MRILAVAPGMDFSVEDVHNGWVAGLRQAGATVAEFNLNERLNFYSTAMLDRGNGPERALHKDAAHQLALNGLLSACYQVQPDVLLVTSGFFVPGDLLDMIRGRGTRIVLVHTEEPYEHDIDIQRAAHADINIVNDPTRLDAFTELGPAWYQPHCYLPELHRPAPAAPEHRSDFAFVGTGFPSRVAFFEAVDWTGVDVALAGNWMTTLDTSPLRKFLAHDIDCCVANSDAVDLYRGAKASANLYRREANDDTLVNGWAMSPREVEMAAAGCFYLRESRAEGDQLLPMLPVFDGPRDFTEQLGWWLTHDGLREQAARDARNAVSDRTFTNAARRLLAAL